jgi:hypothetical protein
VIQEARNAIAAAHQPQAAPATPGTPGTPVNGAGGSAAD